MKTRKSGAIRIGGGSGFLNDRVDAALELVEKGNIDVLMMETLAERTLALLHVARRKGGPGYWDNLAGRLDVLLPALARHQTKFVTNAGGAAPVECARMVARLARERGIKLKVAAVTGDDVTELVRASDPVLAETREPVSKLGTDIICTNAYLGADAIAAAYAAGADVIVTGRVTDSALALGPIMATLGWEADDKDAMAAGVLAGHLLECGGQATGGYFAEPGLKDVPDIDRIGFPIAEVREDRSITITKPPGSGGRIDRHTVTEQILYEMHDPAAYLTPDVSLDVTAVDLKEAAQDEVRLTGARGHRRPDTLKVLVGVDSGVLAEIEISYAGINCEARARACCRHHQEARGARSDARQSDHPVRSDRREQPVARRRAERRARCAAARRGARAASGRGGPADHRGRVLVCERPGGRRRRAYREPADHPHLHGLRAAREGHAALGIRRGMNG